MSSKENGYDPTTIEISLGAKNQVMSKHVDF